MSSGLNGGTVRFQDNEFDSFHEATCAALFNKYGWQWEQPRRPLNGWRPDFALKGDTPVYVECKGGLRWEDVPCFQELVRYEDAVVGTSGEVLLIPESPRQVQNPRGYDVSVLGFLYDGEKWSYAEVGRWSGRVGFCHSANSWKDRMSGEDVGKSSGDGRYPDIHSDWQLAQHIARGKRVSLFQGFSNSETETWESLEAQPRRQRLTSAALVENGATPTAS